LSVVLSDDLTGLILRCDRASAVSRFENNCPLEIPRQSNEISTDTLLNEIRFKLLKKPVTYRGSEKCRIRREIDAQRLLSGRANCLLEGSLSHAPSTLSMSEDEGLLGRCPECGEEISSVWVLVEYEKSDGSDGIWAECPGCETVVEPE